MHVASVMTFEGPVPEYDEMRRAARVAPAPRPALPPAPGAVPLGQGRPVWADDPHFNLRYHLRHTGAPRARRRRRSSRRSPAASSPSAWTATGRCGRSGSSTASPTAASRSSARRTTRSSTASRASTSRPCSSTSRPTRRRSSRPATTWAPKPAAVGRPAPRRRADRARDGPGRGVPRRPRADPRAAAGRRARSLRDTAAIGETLWATLRPAPPSPLNVRIGPHRRYTWVDGDLREFKAIKDELGGTINDVVLTAVTLALGRWLRRHAFPCDGRRAARARPGVGARRRRARRAGQPRVGDVRAAAGRHRGPRARLPPRARGDGGAEGVRAGGRRPGHHPARRLRAADDPQPGRAPADPPALVQRRRDERPRAAVRALRPRAGG